MQDGPRQVYTQNAKGPAARTPPTRWLWPEQPPDPRLVEPLAQQHALAPLVAAVLLLRGHHDPHAFLHPRLTDLDDPAQLPGCSDAADAIVTAVTDRRPVIIYGDYDVDGVCAAAILWHTLRLAGADVRVYIPHRIDEGYGLNVEAIEGFAMEGTRPLVVSVDCGITALEPARRAAELGLDLIITDHHTFDPGGLPTARVIVHPGLRGEASPLCGAGVAYKLAWRIATTLCGSARLPEAWRRLMLDLLSLAAMATVADVVPLVGENRVITHFGLGQIKRTGLTGLNALIDAARLRQETIDAYHVGFVLGPRLNACGRLGHAAQAARLLTHADDAAELAAMLCRVNEQRREVERDIFAQACVQVDAHRMVRPDRRALVLEAAGWHAGVVGIVASRLVERFHRPVVMLCRDEQAGTSHGSARSVEGVSIHDALATCADLMTKWGGHAMAAGLTLPTASVDRFRDRFIDAVNAQLPEERLVPVTRIDLACTLHDLSDALFTQWSRLAPFGRGNPTPVLGARGVELARPPQRMGGAGKHLKLLLRQQARVIEAIGWDLGDWADELHMGARIDLAFEPRVSTWQGRERHDLLIRDLCVV